jgi:hypothetical protein
MFEPRPYDSAKQAATEYRVRDGSGTTLLMVRWPQSSSSDQVRIIPYGL